jgi:hypothetical protein
MVTPMVILQSAEHRGARKRRAGPDPPHPPAVAQACSPGSDPLAAGPLAAGPLAAGPLAAGLLAANPLAAGALVANPLAAGLAVIADGAVASDG